MAAEPVSPNLLCVCASILLLLGSGSVTFPATTNTPNNRKMARPVISYEARDLSKESLWSGCVALYCC
jgi:hypothetical protein